jgi:hypothetical protein
VGLGEKRLYHRPTAFVHRNAHNGCTTPEWDVRESS